MRMTWSIRHGIFSALQKKMTSGSFGIWFSSYFSRFGLTSFIIISWLLLMKWTQEFHLFGFIISWRSVIRFIYSLFFFCCFSPVALSLLYCNFDDDDAMLCDVSRWQSQKRRAAAHGRPFFLFIIFNYNLLCFSAICRVVVVMLVSDCVRLSHSVLNRAG
jgi:hypothetical protein